ncbi:16S rRNA (guanine(966)-N(2))-methyltransferase RsmD [Cupriavidus gilardii]|uniref:16S rRNA (guanine(966)-N(2))-methyltransferase RsmD n=1 Tax=Cupriavidus gilardii TaxID=82541 RepID=UPI00157FCEB2|nr:16S rRNA (guanine(966)-N(2))-methyltransferase RsmD [Cupriavidus gilardii]MCT9074317.1 16S rRNA (guanine(966)-N(2))-methyltransferase RsmD [Cupriavidus gilardii]QKS62705.1 16S rRNA (guanine(966)-N(2))-methyltransferase RsmD [Cupriavidus gilardii]QQE07185.1 16S rRNA (guanine(966)-N(2))-methyltransferase RsmD [Cupriavidus sp. ISTL7]
MSPRSPSPQPAAGGRSQTAPRGRVPSFSARQAPAQVRIIGGRWKRTPLPVLDAEGLRPTPDRVRETLFNWLGQDLTGQRCLDLFAGSGALGFEAASRGAAHVTMVEANPRVVRQLRDNQGRLGAEQIQIVQGDAFAIAAQMPAASFDVVFLDPPFAEDWIGPALAHAERLTHAAGLVYVESESPLHGADAPVPASLEIVRHARAGAVHFHLLRHRGAAD